MSSRNSCVFALFWFRARASSSPRLLAKVGSTPCNKPFLSWPKLLVGAGAPLRSLWLDVLTLVVAASAGAYLESLMNQLEQEKVSLEAKGMDLGDAKHATSFALRTFAVADKQDRAGKADK